MQFKCEEFTGNSVHYKASIGKKDLEGIVRFPRKSDYSFDNAERFARISADAILNPTVVKVDTSYKGMHGGMIRAESLRKSRKSRKSHSERKAGIVGKATMK